MASNFIFLPPADGGGAVSDVNGGTGSISILAGTGIDVTTFGPNITITNTSPAPSGTANTVAGYDAGGLLISLPGFNIDTFSGGLSQVLTQQPNGGGGWRAVNVLASSFDPIANTPDTTWQVLQVQAALDVNNSGFQMGTNGNALNLLNMNVTHNGTGDVGGLAFINQYYNLGNGTDPIDVKGFAYSYGFGNVNANVNISGPMQGYGFQPSINSAATVSSNTYITGFYDAANLAVATPAYRSFSAGPQISSIINNCNYIAYDNGANITTMVGNSGYTGVGIFPTIGTLSATGGFQGIAVSPSIGTAPNGVTGINVTPTVTLNENYVTGLNVSVNGVTNAPGATASLVVQDITYTMNVAGTDGNNTTVEYTNTVTAGNEVAIVNAPAHIVVSIESGVSTATQVKAALDANFSIASNVTTAITGTASNPQVTYAETNLAGGINPGTKKAAQFDGDVSINGALSFTGGLSVGALQSFATVDLATLPGGVNSVDTLITQPTLAASASSLGKDLLAINTAMLMTLGDNSTATSSFLGYSALGLPAVLSMGTGSTIDLVNGAVFAISLDAAATGGVADAVNLCRALAIPNGATTVTNLKGYAFDLPFGDPGTTTWGFYASPTSHNYFAGDLMVGGTAGSDDTPANASVGIELKSTVKAFLPSRMTTTERDALTAVNGMVLYNTTTDKLQVYAAGSWVDLH